MPKQNKMVYEHFRKELAACEKFDPSDYIDDLNELSVTNKPEHEEPKR
jgi:hypothetical protein